MDLGGSFATWEQRFRLGQSEAAAADFIQSSIGSAFWPGLRPGDSLLARITGLSAGLDLGSSTASQHVFAGTAAIGLAYGLTSRLTVFGTLPIRRVQVRSSLGQDSATANAGYNPADPTFGDGFGAGQDANFFAQFDAALTSLQRNLANGVYDGDPAARQLAVQTLASGNALRGDLFALLVAPTTASPFLPTGSSALGSALLNTVTSLQSVLSGSLAVPGFTLSPALPSRRLDSAGFEGFITNPSGPVAGSLSSPVLAALGDIELGAAYLLLDRWRLDGRSGVRVAAQVLGRLRTAQLDNPSRFFDVGTGDRQPDLEAGITADLMRGRIGARLSGSYNLQLAGSAQKRIALPAQPIPWANTLAAVRRTPGNELALGIQPFYKFSRTFALTVGGHYLSHASDRYELLEGQAELPGYPVSQLAEESQASWLTASAGLTFSAPLESDDRGLHPPLDAGLSYRTVVSASGGRVPKVAEVRTFIRIYTRFP
jgi:hypothetical protein